VIVVVDPGARSTNLGDRIISDAVTEYFLDPLTASGREVRRVPLHGELTEGDRILVRQASDVVVCGTNLLSSHMRFRSPWQWPTSDIELARGKLTVLGAGWWQYQRSAIDPWTARWLRSLAGPKPWAVRDLYSQAKLNRAGVAAVHLSCPTVWTLDEQRLPADERRVVVTLTDYSQDPLADRRLHRWLAAKFEEVTYWPQGPGDARYIRDLLGDVTLLPPTLTALDAALDEVDTAYVGLRLHAGIRAIQRGVPSLILSVDNRAREIAGSIGLGVASRYRMSEVQRLGSSGRALALAVPHAAIESWLGQWQLGRVRADVRSTA
jgi:polysaccharide pyruvyl transferase WcaK-like protein